MTQSDDSPRPPVQDVALIVGGGPGISSSCARLFAKAGMRVGIMRGMLRVMVEL